MAIHMLSKILGKTLFPGGRRTAQQRADTKALQSQRGKETADLVKARRAAELHPAIQIEKDRAGGYWVTCDGITDTPQDPLDGQHFASTGREVLESVLVYVALLKGEARP